MAEVIDNRLVCAHCGELGTLVERERKYCWITCAGNQGGAWCCCTRTYPTQGEAIAAWKQLWQEPEEAEVQP